MPALIPTAGFSHESAVYLSQSLKSWGHWFVFNFLLLWIQEELLIFFFNPFSIILVLMMEWWLSKLVTCGSRNQNSKWTLDFIWSFWGRHFWGDVNRKVTQFIFLKYDSGWRIKSGSKETNRRLPKSPKQEWTTSGTSGGSEEPLNVMWILEVGPTCGVERK